jgi:ketosteroid isomerase-like protein
MPTRAPPIFTTPADAAAAFYRALETKDIDAMMATWADDEDIVCVHPGGPRHVGYDAVRASFASIFAADERLTFELGEVVLLETVGLAMQSAVENIGVEGERTARAAAFATNVFMRTPSGWRVVAHHASPAPAASAQARGGPLH